MKGDWKLLNTYSYDITIQECKKKQKLLYKIAWIYGLIGIIAYASATYYYFTRFLIGTTLLLVTISVITFIGAIYFKIEEGNLSTIINIRKEK